MELAAEHLFCGALLSEARQVPPTSGSLDGMLACPADGVDKFARFNGNDGPYNPSATSVYQDNVESYTTTEPAIDLTASSFLMWSWRMAGHPTPLSDLKWNR